MKVILVNGSPHERGTTYHALAEAAATLHKEGIETEIFWIGSKPVGGCIGCRGCSKTKECVFDGPVNEFKRKAKEADGFIFGSPVHYAGISGSMAGFMDRVFYSGSRDFRLKAAAGVVCARRGGCTAAFDQLNKYFTISQMIVVSSCYWNMVHGAFGDQCLEDLEGMKTMRVLAKNMAYVLRCQKAAKAAGVPLPEPEEPVFTNFIR